LADTDKKELLVRVAIDLFAQKGFAVTSMRDIAKTAKVNVALIYYYFKNKEEILYHIMASSSRELIVILKEIQSGEPDPWGCLKKMIVRQVLYSSRSWKQTKFISIEGDHLHGQRKKDCAQLQRQVYDIYMEQLRRLKEANYLADLDLTVLIFTIFGMIGWFYRWYEEGGPLSEEEVANEMTKILESGILKKNGSATVIKRKNTV
jgi:AcrR family transcriptional regulator